MSTFGSSGANNGLESPKRVVTSFQQQQQQHHHRQLPQQRYLSTFQSTAMNSAKQQNIPDMDDIVSLCKRRGIIFPTSEIYNGYAGFFDYGPLGVELKKNIKDAWWQYFVTQREDVVGLDSSIIQNPATWKSSGTSHMIYVASVVIIVAAHVFFLGAFLTNAASVLFCAMFFV